MMDGNWKLVVTLTAHNCSFDMIKRELTKAAEHVARAKTPNEARASYGGGSGGAGGSTRIEIECPAEEQIKELRAQADQLEASITSRAVGE